MASMFITRKEYDRMIERAATIETNGIDGYSLIGDYMKLGRKWSLLGVTVTADESESEEFQRVHELWSAVCDR